MRARIKQTLNLVFSVALLVIPGLVSRVDATPTPTFTYYHIPTPNSAPSNIIQGPDNGMWFTESNANKIGHLTTAGQIVEYPVPGDNPRPMDLTVGSDGAIWFTEYFGNKIGRITPDGQVTDFPVPTANSLPNAIAAEADGALWFTEFNSHHIGRITTDGQVTEYTSYGIPYDIIKGADLAIWSTANADDFIDRYTLDGAISQHYDTTRYSDPLKLTNGPDGAVWFTEGSSTGDPTAGNNIGRMTTDGVLAEYPFADDGMPGGITDGPENALWAVWNGSGVSNKVYKVATDGTMTDYTAGQALGYLSDVTSDTAGNVWFLDRDYNTIVKMNPASTPPPPEAAYLAMTPDEGVGDVDGSATFSVTATDPARQPVVGATVRFTVNGSDTSSGTCTTDTAGQCSYSYTGPSLPGADSISAYVDSNENQQLDVGEPSATSTQAWLLPQVVAGQVTGGGHLASTNSTRDIAFGFTAKSSDSLSSGACQIIDPASSLDIHCTSVDSLVVASNHASIFGTASINHSATTVSYRIDVTDNATPGSGADSFAVQTSTGYSVSGLLETGNIQVHQ